jgi:hypothetical protein
LLFSSPSPPKNAKFMNVRNIELSLQFVVCMKLDISCASHHP